MSTPRPHRRPGSCPNLLILLLLWAAGTGHAGAQTGSIEDIRPGPDGSSPRSSAPLDGLIVFSADDGETGREPWVSDGTAEGTFRLADIFAGTEASEPTSLTRFKQWVVFYADQPGTGRELWRTDGTRAGTAILKELNPGVADGCGRVSAGGACRQFTAVGDELFFYGYDGEVGAELWKTDGTGEGTVLVKDINPGPAGSSVCGLTAYKGQLIFAASDNETGLEVWRSDGTPEGTQRVKDIWEGPQAGLGICEPGPGAPAPGFTEMNGLLYFTADRPDLGEELWVTDGTEAGTQLVKDINPGATDSLPNFMTVFRDELYFAARRSSSEGYELWKSDGTADGTVLVREIHEGSADGLVRSDGNTALVVANGELFFNADDGVHGRELWKTDGTGAGTLLVRDLVPGADGSTPRGFEPSSGTLFFAADGPAGTELYRSNGTEVGTVLVKDIAPGEAAAAPDGLTDAWGRLTFSADDGTTGDELWRSGEPVQPLAIEGLPALNANGLPEVAVLVRDFQAGDGHNLVLVKDAQGGKTISNAEFFDAAWRAQDLVVVDQGDLSRVAVLAVRDTGRIAVQQRVARNGKAVGLTTYFDKRWRALGAATVYNEGSTAIAVLAVGPKGQVSVEARKIGNGKLLQRITYFGSAAHPVTFASVPDMNGNGMAEIAVLVQKLNGTFLVAIRDLGDRSLVSQFALYGANWRPIDLGVLESIDGNPSPDLAVLAEKDNGNIAVELRDGSSGRQIRRILFLSQAWTAHELRILPDANGNGAPELAVLAVNGSGRIGVEVRDAATGARLNRTKYLTTSYSPVGMAILDNLGASQAGELAVLAFANEGGDLRVQARDGRNGNLIRTLPIP